MPDPTTIADKKVMDPKDESRAPARTPPHTPPHDLALEAFKFPRPAAAISNELEVEHRGSMPAGEEEKDTGLLNFTALDDNVHPCRPQQAVRLSRSTACTPFRVTNTTKPKPIAIPSSDEDHDEPRGRRVHRIQPADISYKRAATPLSRLDAARKALREKHALRDSYAPISLNRYNQVCPRPAAGLREARSRIDPLAYNTKAAYAQRDERWDETMHLSAAEVTAAAGNHLIAARRILKNDKRLRRRVPEPGMVDRKGRKPIVVRRRARSIHEGIEFGYDSLLEEEEEKKEEKKEEEVDGGGEDGVGVGVGYNSSPNFHMHAARRQKITSNVRIGDLKIPSIAEVLGLRPPPPTPTSQPPRPYMVTPRNGPRMNMNSSIWPTYNLPTSSSSSSYLQIPPGRNNHAQYREYPAREAAEATESLWMKLLGALGRSLGRRV